MTKKLLVLVGIAVFASSAMGAATLYKIDPLGSDTATYAYGMTPDGAYVVGKSGTKGILWKASDQSVTQVIAGDMDAATANGAGYRTVGGQTVLTLAGMSDGWVTSYSSTDGGATFTGYRVAASPYQGTMSNNALAGTSTDAFFMAFRQGNAPQWLGKGSGETLPGSIAWDVYNAPTKGYMEGVSGTGKAVGRSTFDNSEDPGGFAGYHALLYTYESDGTLGVSLLPGLTGTTNDYGLGIDASGTKFSGASQVGGSFVPWVSDGSTVTALPLTGTFTGSSFAYAMSPDGNFVVGTDYTIEGKEKAALWDISSSNPADWIVVDLTAFAADAGILGEFTLLSRAYSVGTNANGQPVISGYGAATGGTRGFVLTVPEPTSVLLLVLGGVALLRRR